MHVTTIEPISPNVKYINPDMFNFLDYYFDYFGSSEASINNEIIVIDIGLGENKIQENIKLLFDNKKNPVYDVSVTGRVEDKEMGIGSKRFCTSSYTLSKFINKVLKRYPFAKRFKDLNNQWWDYVGVSTYWRFMKYNNGGEHCPHYDSDFQTGPDEYTKMSCVIYFTDCSDGEIAFINDETEFADKKEDWNRQAREDEIFLKIKPKFMKIVIFPHTLCHSVLPFNNINGEETRIIARGDLIFKKVN